MMGSQAVNDVDASSARVNPFESHCTATGINSTDRAAWLAARRTGLGGSDVAAILHLHPYKSALEVYADKVGASAPDADAGEIALWGHILEGPILAEFARRTKRTVLASGELFKSKARRSLIVTPDGIQLDCAPRWAVGPGTAEVKTTGYGAQWHEEIPAYVQVQKQHEMLVTGATWGSLIWLPLPERKLQWFDVAPHREFQAMLAEKCSEFWLRVIERRPPDPDGSESARRALHALHPELDDQTIELDQDAEAVADEAERIAAAIAALEERKKLISNRVIATLGSEKVALLSSGRYWNSWTCEPRETKCPSCDAVTGTTAGFRAVRLMQPRKKPHPLPVERRSLATPASAEIAKLLEASLESVRRGAA